MAARRKVVEIAVNASDAVQLQLIACLRREPASRVERARILLHHRDESSYYAVGSDGI